MFCCAPSPCESTVQLQCGGRERPLSRSKGSSSELRMTTILIAAINFVVGVITGAIALIAFAGWTRTADAHEYPVEIFALSEEDGRGFLALAPDLPGCMADGWTQREALANLHDAIAEWIEDARAVDRPVPEPKYC